MEIDIKPGPSEEPVAPIDVAPGTSAEPKLSIKPDISEETSAPSKVDIKFFECSTCILRVQFEYFGKDPPWYKNYRLMEEAYVIEDPFSPPKQNKIIILGAHCVKCNRIVCKDSTCSIYFEGTYCIKCAKSNMDLFPTSVQSKLNKIVECK